MPCAFGVPGSTISGSGCVVEAQRRGREGGRIAPACPSVLVSAATYLAQPFGIGNEFVRDGTIHLPYASRQVEFLNPTWIEEVTVSDVMTREVQSLGPDCSVEVAASLMRRSQIHRVLVMEDRRLLGVVTTTDLARTVAERGIRSSTQVA